MNSWRCVYVLIAVLAVSAFLAGCSSGGEGPGLEPVELQEPQQVDQSQEPEQVEELQGSVQMLTCVDIAVLAAPFIGSMTLGPSSETDDEVYCVWGDPGTTLLDGSTLDFLVNIRYFESHKAWTLSGYCEVARTMASDLDSIGGCAIDSIDISPPGLRGTVPFYDIGLLYLCAREGSTLCIPNIPVTNEVAVSALESIAGRLHTSR